MAEMSDLRIFLNQRIAEMEGRSDEDKHEPRDLREFLRIVTALSLDEAAELAILRGVASAWKESPGYDPRWEITASP